MLRFKLAFWVLQIRVLAFGKFSGSTKSGIFYRWLFPNFIGFKIGSWFLFKKFCVKLAQVSEISFKIFSLVFGKQAFSFCKVHFFWLAFSLVKSSSQNWLQGFSKSIGKFGSGFSAKFLFSGTVNSSQSQFFSMGFSKSSALAFW